MGLLLYKSDEMYSSTELIRKSKMIFDKVLDKKIEKAIILRDGKPCFLLMEFKKYEKIMAEYEELKEYVGKIKNKKPLVNECVEKESIQTPFKKQKSKERVPQKVKVPIQTITPEDKQKIEKITTAKIPKVEMPMEIKVQKAESEHDIKARILKARNERAKILADEKQHKEDLKEELILQNQLKETKMKKDRELQEFWD